MSLRIVPDFVAPDHPIRSHRFMAPRRITIHETANRRVGANARMHGDYIDSPAAIDRTVLWHATVDDQEVWQHLPWNEVGWHAGDGKHGPGNTDSIGVELCVNDDSNFFKTMRNAARLVTFLKQTIPSLLPFPQLMAQHHTWSGKNCPAVIRNIPGGWNGFLDMCWEELNPKPLEPAPAFLTAPVLLDGKELSEKAILIGGRSYLPVRTAGEAMGMGVHWDQAGWRVLLASGK